MGRMGLQKDTFILPYSSPFLQMKEGGSLWEFTIVLLVAELLNKKVSLITEVFSLLNYKDWVSEGRIVKSWLIYNT